MKEIPLLTSEDIEVKIKQCTKNGALGLLYKTARVDRKILNDVYGPLNWTSDYKVVKDNLYCGIGIRESEDQDFVWKWDCGIESRADDEGNEKKGEASDAFKRAASAVGIGEELYSSPAIWLKVQTEQGKDGKWRLTNPYAKYIVTDIEYNPKTRVITKIIIANAETNIEVFTWALNTTGAIGKKMVKTVGAATDDTKSTVEATTTTKKASKEAVTATKDTVVENTSSSDEPTLQDLISEIGRIVKKMKAVDEGNFSKYKEIVTEVAGAGFKCNAATEKDYDIVKKVRDTLVEKGYAA